MPPTLTLGGSSSRSACTRSALSWGLVVGTTVSSAALSSALRCGAETKATPSVSRIVVGCFVQRLRVVRRDEQRTVGAGPEAAADHVVGGAGRRALAVVAGVREAEPEVEHGRGQHEHERRRCDQRCCGAPLHHPAPARGRRVVAGQRAAAEAGDAQPVDLVAGEGQQRGQQRDRGGHHHEHGEAGGQRDALQVADAHEEQAVDADQHGGAGDEHGPAGGLDGFSDGLAGRAGLQRGAEAGEHEQRVVDADADADQAGHGGREVGHVDEGGEDGDEAGRDAEAEQGDGERQAGGDDRAEGDQQDHRGGHHADALRAPALLGVLDHHTADGDLHVIGAALLGQPDQLLPGLGRDVPAAAGELELRHADRAVGRHAGALGISDAGHLSRLGDEAVDRVLGTGLVGALPRNGDELTTAFELLVQQLSHFLRLRAPGPEVGI